MTVMTSSAYRAAALRSRRQAAARARGLVVVGTLMLLTRVCRVTGGHHAHGTTHRGASGSRRALVEVENTAGRVGLGQPIHDGAHPDRDDISMRSAGRATTGGGEGAAYDPPMAADAAGSGASKGSGRFGGEGVRGSSSPDGGRVDPSGGGGGAVVAGSTDRPGGLTAGGVSSSSAAVDDAGGTTRVAEGSEVASSSSSPPTAGGATPESGAALGRTTSASDTRDGEEGEGVGSAPARLVRRHPDDTVVFPADISGAFKGKWTPVPSLGNDGAANGTTGERLPGMKAFLGEDGAGALVLQLHSKWDARRNVQWVQGWGAATPRDASLRFPPDA